MLYVVADSLDFSTFMDKIRASTFCLSWVIMVAIVVEGKLVVCNIFIMFNA